MMNDILNRIDSEQVFRLSDSVAVEMFDDGALALRLDDRVLFELNTIAKDVLMLTDGILPVREVARKLVQDYDISYQQGLDDVVELYRMLSIQKIVFTECP